MAAGASVRDSDFTIKVDTAMKQAANTGRVISGVNSPMPGRRMITTHTKPTAAAVQRRARTASPTENAAPVGEEGGTGKFSATESARAREERKRGVEGKRVAIRVGVGGSG